MAKSKVMKIMPQLDARALATLDRQLGASFRKVGKAFGAEMGKNAKLFTRTLSTGILRASDLMKRGAKGAGKTMANGVKTLAGGSLIGLGMNLIQMTKSQYQDAAAEMDKQLKQADDLQTLASSMGADAYKTKQFLQLGQLKGLDAEAMQKFALTMIELRRKEKEEPGSTGLKKEHLEGSAIDALLGTFQGLKAMADEGKSEKATALFAKFFGQRLAGRALEIIQNDIGGLLKQAAISKEDAGTYNALVAKAGELEEKQTILNQQRELDEEIKRLGKINENYLTIQNNMETVRGQRLTDNLGAERFANSALVTQTIESGEQKLIELANTGLAETIKFIRETVPKIMETIKEGKEKLDGIITTIKDTKESIENSKLLKWIGLGQEKKNQVDAAKIGE